MDFEFVSLHIVIWGPTKKNTNNYVRQVVETFFGWAGSHVSARTSYDKSETHTYLDLSIDTASATAWSLLPS